MAESSSHIHTIGGLHLRFEHALSDCEGTKQTVGPTEGTRTRGIRQKDRKLADVFRRPEQARFHVDTGFGYDACRHAVSYPRFLHLRLRGGVDAAKSSGSADLDAEFEVPGDLAEAHNTTIPKSRNSSAEQMVTAVSPLTEAKEVRRKNRLRKNGCNPLRAKDSSTTPSFSSFSNQPQLRANFKLLMHQCTQILSSLLAILFSLIKSLLSVQERIGGLVLWAARPCMDGLADLVSLCVEGTLAYKDAGLYGVIVWLKSEWAAADAEEDDEQDDEEDGREQGDDLKVDLKHDEEILDHDTEVRHEQMRLEKNNGDFEAEFRTSAQVTSNSRKGQDAAQDNWGKEGKEDQEKGGGEEDEEDQNINHEDMLWNAFVMDLKSKLGHDLDPDILEIAKKEGVAGLQKMLEVNNIF